LALDFFKVAASGFLAAVFLALPMFVSFIPRNENCKGVLNDCPVVNKPLAWGGAKVSNWSCERKSYDFKTGSGR
jgi:hypothetical protein